MTVKTFPKRALLLFGAAASVAIVWAATGTSAATKSPAAAQAQASGISQAKALVQAAMNAPSFKGPKTSFDMSKNKGKTVWFISPVSVPFVLDIIKGAKEAAAAAGIKLVVFDGKGLVTEWNKGVREAVAQKADGIILQAEDPTLVSTPLAAARAAHIPVIDAEVSDPTSPKAPGIFAHVTIDFSRGGRLLADYMTWKSGGNAHAIAFYDSHFSVHRIILGGLKSELSRVCPRCKLTTEVADSAQIATQGPAKTANVLRRQPDTNWLVAIADYEAPWLLQGVRTAGATGKVRLIGHDAVFDNLKLIRKGQGQEADPGIPLGWKGWAEIDEIGRAMAGEPPANENIPYRFFTKENLPRSGTLTSAIFGKTDYRSAYKKLWGLK
jgi:ribose transport system substrate-binding protein